VPEEPQVEVGTPPSTGVERPEEVDRVRAPRGEIRERDLHDQDEEHERDPDPCPSLLEKRRGALRSYDLGRKNPASRNRRPRPTAALTV